MKHIIKCRNDFLKSNSILFLFALFIILNGFSYIGDPSYAEVVIKKLSNLRPYDSISPAVISSSGNRIAYISWAYTAGNPSAVMVVNADGSGETGLFRSHEMTDPYQNGKVLKIEGGLQISGDGNTVAFPVESYKKGEAVYREDPSYLCIFNYSNGGWDKPLLIRFSNIADDGFVVSSVSVPSITDDGSKIIARVSFSNFGAEKYYECIILTDKNGSSPRSLLSYKSGEQYSMSSSCSPIISGNGDRIIFNGNESSDYNTRAVVYSMKSDGAGLIKISPADSTVSGEYLITADAVTVGFYYWNSQMGDYLLVNALDGSNPRAIHTYAGYSIYTGAYGKPQITPDGSRLFYSFYNELAESYAFYRKNTDDTGDLIVLGGETRELPWDYSYITAGTTGSQFNMDRSGDRFIVIKGIAEKGEHLYLIEVKSADPMKLKYDNSLADPCASNEKFVRLLYNCIFEAEPDISLLNLYIKRLEDGLPREEIILRFFTSSLYYRMKKTDSDFIRDVYQAVLATEPDINELKSWENFLKDKKDRAGFINIFLKSSDYKKTKDNCPG